jgi:DNA invertase Pin-like site-specific DNA recombinase
MQKVYGYIRVSTKEQGYGASLPEQRSAIIEFALKNKLKIIHFYEEKKTAAKRGRPFFTEMLQNLKDGKADGVIMHKIDRSARNLHDWASIGDLIDNKIRVYFAHESLDLNERGGRLSADIQAVMASDYVRNLRQEITKGLYGRLKQGLYPWKAPIGYIDNGRGELKTIDPVQSDLVKQLFNLYVTGKYNVLELSKEMEKRDLKNWRGNRVSKNTIGRILKNPFYIGITKVNGKTFNGKHQAIIDTRLFNQVQLIMNNRRRSKGVIHDYLFNKYIKCQHCKYFMSGECQKGHIYYRCKTKTCPTKTIREDHVEYYVKNILKTIKLNQREIQMLNDIIEENRKDIIMTQEIALNGFKLKERQLETKEQKLLDTFLDGIIEKEKYKQYREKILIDQKENKEKKEAIVKNHDGILDAIENLVELCKSPLKLYESSIKEEKRELLETISSNLSIDRRKAIFSMESPFHELANRNIFSLCDVNRDNNRTLYRKQVYMDKNTGPIVPKPMNRRQIKKFFEFLLETLHKLPIPKHSICEHEISTNNPSTQQAI